MKKNRAWAAILSFCLATVVVGCVTTEKMPEAAVEPQVENMQKSEAAIEPPQALPEDPCASMVAELAGKARTTMKTASGTCQDQRIEANPMWSVHYDGTVRVRIYDAAGKLQSSETTTP